MNSEIASRLTLKSVEKARSTAGRALEMEQKVAELKVDERRLIASRYWNMVLMGHLPIIHAWIKLDPDGRWTVYVGREYSPRSNLRYSFNRDQLDTAHTFARKVVVKKMRAAMRVWDGMRR